MNKGKSITWKGLMIPVVIIAIWIVSSVAGKLNTALFPSFGQVCHAFYSMARGGVLFSHIADSFYRVFVGFVLATLVGVPLGLVLGCIPQSQVWFGPILHFLRQIPPTAWIPVFLLWFGIGDAPKFAVIFYAAVFPIVINTSLGVQQIPKEYWEVNRALCISPLRTLKTLVLPGSYHAMLTGLRLGMGTSWRAIVAAEMLASASGLGYLVMSSRALVRVDEMLAGIILIGFIGVVVDGLFVRLQNNMIPSWKWGIKARGEEIGQPTTTVGAYLQDF